MSSASDLSLITEVSVNLEVIHQIRKEMWYQNEDQKSNQSSRGEHCARCNLKSRSREGKSCYCEIQIEVLLDKVNKNQKELFDILSSKYDLKDKVKELASRWVKFLKDELDKEVKSKSL